MNILERNRRLRTQELSVSEHQNFKIFSDSMLPDPPPARSSALMWFVGYQNTSWLYVLKRLNSLTIKNWKWKIYKVIFKFWFIWSFAASACMRQTPKNPHPKEKPLAFWVFRKAKKNIEQTLKLHQIWTGLWAPDSNHWITATWSRIRNLSLNTELIYPATN